MTKPSEGKEHPGLFIRLRDTTGRTSFVLVDYDSVEIVGVLPHGTKFTVEEFDRFCREYLESVRAFTIANYEAALNLARTALREATRTAAKKAEHEARVALHQAFEALERARGEKS